MTRLLHRLAVGCWYAFAALAVASAVLLSLVRLLLPLADRYRSDVEAWVSARLGQPVKIETFDAAWQGLGPVLELRGVRLLDKQAGETLLGFDELHLAVSLYDSLLAARVELSGLQVAGVRLAIQRRTDGSLALQGFAPARAGEAQGDSTEAVDWLLAQERLGFRDCEIVWQDLQAGGPPLHFSDVDLTLHNAGLQHRLQGSVDLPDRLGGRLEVGFDFEGDAGEPAGWAGNLYLKGAAVNLAGWPVTLPGATQVAGVADFELWSEWREARPVRVEGAIGVRDLAVADGKDASGTGGDARRAAVDQAQGQVRWQRESAGWSLDVSRLNVMRGGRAWPETRLAVDAGTDDVGGLRSVRAQAGFLAIEDVAAVAGPFLPEPLKSPLAGIRPQGELRDLEVAYQSQGADGTPAYTVQARFARVGGEAWQALPAVSGLTGTLQADERAGAVVLNSPAVRVGFSRLFRDPLDVALLTGTLAWERGPEGWRLHSEDLAASNADLRTRTRIALDVPRDAAPFLDMQVVYEEGDISHAHRYLPVGIMPPDVVHWLDRALVSGRVTSGNMLFHGHPGDFPFDRGTGKFEVRFNVADAVLDYQEGWPRIEELEAEVAFSGRSMSVQAVRGKIFNADLVQVRADIPNLHHARLGVRGQVQGPLADMLRVLKEGPLAAQYGGYLDGVRAEGPALLSLDLDLPLYRGGEHKVGGTVEFRNATLAAPDWNLSLAQLNGPLTFSNAGLAARSLNARLFGQKVQIQVVPAEAGAEVTVGGPDLAGLAKQFQVGIPPDVQGTAAWEARLRVPVAGKEGWRGAALELVLASDLDGVVVALPTPLGKSAEQLRALTVRLPLSGAEPRAVSVRYGDLLDALLEVRRSAGGPALPRGEVRLGGGEAHLPPDPGIQVTGRLGRLSLEAWHDWLARPARAGRGGDAAGPLGVLDLSVGRLDAFGQMFEDTRVVARKTGPEWVVRVEGADAAGIIRMPYPLPPGGSVVMAFDHLHLRAAEGEEDGTPPDPRRIPALQVTSKRFVYGGSDFGSMELRTSPRQDGMHLDELLLQSSVLRARIQGDWLAGQGEQRSDFEIALDSSDLAESARLLGYAAAVEGSGPGHMEISATWPGAPAQFALERLDGRLYLQIGKGRFLEIEPGMGRMFGLLSLQTLPRRLSLDFSDLLRKGFTFDRIEGHFSIADGDAYTHDLYLDGPAAHVEVVGRTGLDSRDYDQVMTVTPRLGSSLPLAGALAGGPGMGVALFLAEKLFRTQIDQVTRVQYTVTGPWDMPVIERVLPPGERVQEDAP